MREKKNRTNEDVTNFIESLKHPLKKEIHYLREVILKADHHLSEDIKWNAPNYKASGIDCITMKIQPAAVIQLIFHRGAKVLEQPNHKLIEAEEGLLVWKANDRAVATFKNMDAISSNEQLIIEVVKKWVAHFLNK